MRYSILWQIQRKKRYEHIISTYLYGICVRGTQRGRVQFCPREKRILLWLSVSDTISFHVTQFSVKLFYFMLFPRQTTLLRWSLCNCSDGANARLFVCVCPFVQLLLLTLKCIFHHHHHKKQLQHYFNENWIATREMQRNVRTERKGVRRRNSERTKYSKEVWERKRQSQKERETELVKRKLSCKVLLSLKLKTSEEIKGMME